MMDANDYRACATCNAITRTQDVTAHEQWHRAALAEAVEQAVAEVNKQVQKGLRNRPGGGRY